MFWKFYLAKTCLTSRYVVIYNNFLKDTCTIYAILIVSLTNYYEDVYVKEQVFYYF